MPRPIKQRPADVAELHRQWLQLVDTDGPFLAVPVLKRVWPNGMPTLGAERKQILGDARKPFEAAWEAVDAHPDDEGRLERLRKERDVWVETVLRDVIGWKDALTWGEVPGLLARSPNHAVMVSAQAALHGPDGIGAVVQVIDPTDSLRETPNDLWAATPVDRMEVLLRENHVEVGVVTDGRWWGLVSARTGTMAASGIVDAFDWIAEPRTRDAFFALASRQHIIGGDPNERLPKLFEDSVAAAEEITEALGGQVRRAVELLIQAFSESAAEALQHGLPDPLPTRGHDAYEAAVTVMMRVVFLLFAEERGLLPTGELFEQGYGISRELDVLRARQGDEGEEALDATTLTWYRLLATSRALYQGASFENMRMPAYGGSLFDPARFEFLTATNEHGSLALSVSDRVMFQVLRSVQQAELKGQPARRISFRDIDVEQIGYIYEGLLGYTAARASETVVGLRGAAGEEPEVPLAVLELLLNENEDPKRFAAALCKWIETDQPSAKPQSISAIAKSVDAPVEPHVLSALSAAVGDDPELRAHVLPVLSLLRTDLRERPFVVRKGGLMVKETPSRKNAGAHYTPKSLAEEIVLHALEPLCYSPGPYQTADKSEWHLKSSDEILGLKIADIACGSGAFLVAAARYLADRAVEAWVTEDPANKTRRDLHLRAMREVVANCLYGADINDMAVEMCKLSLWLVSLDGGLPFSFVDDKVFLGNSLLGITSLDQLRKMHIDPERVPHGLQLELFDVDVDSIIRRAIELRHKLSMEIDDADPARSNAAKRRQLAELNQFTTDLRRTADGVIATGLAQGGVPGKALDHQYESLRDAVRAAHPANGDVADGNWLWRITDRGLTPTVTTDYYRWKPLHWVLEAPEVMVDRGGFDAIVGNPPFLGGQKLTGAMGTNFRNWIVNVLAGGVRGSADFVAYFFLRAASLLAQNGTFGLIATNTISQGDTRAVALDPLVQSGMTITRSIRSRSWPASSANLEFAAVWGTTATLANDLPMICDDIPVRRISTLLEPEGRATGSPTRLVQNMGIAFQGCIVLGMGFVLSREEAEDWIRREPKNADVLYPYLNGEDVNGRADCTASRWVIDFNSRSEDEAQAYTLPFARAFEHVRPERQRVDEEGRFVLRAPLPERWWQYGEKRPALRTTIASLDEVLVIALVSKSVMPLRVPTSQVFSHALGVFATNSFADQAVLSSSLHQMWAIKYGSGMRNDPRYTPSDVFETYALPRRTEWLEAAGRTLQDERSAIMRERSLGVTDLYNLVNSSGVLNSQDRHVARLRAIHVEIDSAVMDAYGWTDITMNHGFHSYRRMTRWSLDPAARVEVLDRLLELNQLRASEPAKRPNTIGHVKAPAGQDALFA